MTEADEARSEPEADIEALLPQRREWRPRWKRLPRHRRRTVKLDLMRGDAADTFEEALLAVCLARRWKRQRIFLPLILPLAPPAAAGVRILFGTPPSLAWAESLRDLTTWGVALMAVAVGMGGQEKIAQAEKANLEFLRELLRLSPSTRQELESRSRER